MKLKCVESNYLGWDLFTTGKEYEVLVISPNRLMVSVINDGGEETNVVFNTSVYGKFELLESE